MFGDRRGVEEVVEGWQRRRRKIRRSIAEVIILIGDEEERLELVERPHRDVRYDLVNVRRETSVLVRSVSPVHRTFCFPQGDVTRKGQVIFVIVYHGRSRLSSKQYSLLVLQDMATLNKALLADKVSPLAPLLVCSILWVQERRQDVGYAWSESPQVLSKLIQ